MGSVDQDVVNGIAYEEDGRRVCDYDGGPVPETDEFGYRIREQPYGTKRKLRVLLMGAGASALNFFKKAEEQMESLEIVCYEKNKDIGGTWLENRYPGCACDIPSANYQFTWKARLWSHYYSFAPEIWEYLKEIERENDFIAKYVKLRHQIESAEWDPKASLWRFRIRNLDTNTVVTDQAHFFLNAGGTLNDWRWPDIPGLHSFKGKLMHSAAYEEGYDLTDKRVAVVGAGSSGVQIVAAIQPKVQHLYHWIRSPIWITAGFAQRWAGRDGANFAYTPEQLQYLEDNPEKYLEYRKQIENELNQRFRFILRGSPESVAAREYSLSEMRRKLKYDPRLCDAIIPKSFNPGCRRPTPAPGYLEALTAPNTTVFTTSMSQVDETGFTDPSGQHHEIDVLICATGFNTSWLPRFHLSNGQTTLPALFAANGVSSYLSIGIPTFPNYFTFCGPYGPVGHGSFMPLIETWTAYILAAVAKCQTEAITSLTPRLDASNQFRQHADLFLRRTAWTQPCRSWFKNGTVQGKPAIWPGSRLHFLQLLAAPRWEDYEFEYEEARNRFAFLGNGFQTREEDGRDRTYYLGLMGALDTQPLWDERLIERLGGEGVGESFHVNGRREADAHAERAKGTGT